MLQSTAIDVAIGLILMYLVLSLLCTVVNEFIATKLKLRSKALEEALQKIIDDGTLRAAFYDHGLISSNSRASATGSQTTLEALTNAPEALRGMLGSQPGPANAAPDPAATATPKSDHPSYLASGTVASALLDILLKKGKAADPNLATNIEQIKTGLALIGADTKIKESLEASLLQAQNDVQDLRKSVATWFDDSMERLSGAYKRQMKWISMLIGLLVAVAFNADTLNVATTLWSDGDRRASAVAIATKMAEKQIAASGENVDQAKLANDIKQAEATLRSLPIGWNCPLQGREGTISDYWSCAQQKVPTLSLIQIIGWLLTAVALSLGAPFWFDLLNKFIKIRAAGDKPKREDEKTA
jgi:hypothetical protein